MTQVVYAREKTPPMEGRKFQNPRFFAGPVEGVTKVYIDGDWPVIREAYEAAKVPVAPLSEMRAMPGHAQDKEPNK